MVGRKTAEALGSSQCVIFEYDGQRQGTVFRAFYDSSGEPWENSVGELLRVRCLSRGSRDHPRPCTGAGVPLRRSAAPGVTRVDGALGREVLSECAAAVQRRTCRDAGAHRDQSRTRLHTTGDRAGSGARRAGRCGHQARQALPAARGAERAARLIARDEPRHDRLTRRARGASCACATRWRGCSPRRPRTSRSACVSKMAALRPSTRRSPKSKGASRWYQRRRTSPPARLRRPTMRAGMRWPPCCRPRSRTPAAHRGSSCRWCSRTRPQGYVDALGWPGRPFAQEQVELVQILANQAAVAVENARLYRTIERQAITDGLTGLYNHRYFYERLFQEFARAQRYGVPLSLLMIDIDDFKRSTTASDTPSATTCWSRWPASSAASSGSDVDLAARYGGEEFVVLLPNTPREGAKIVGDRLKQRVAGFAPGAAGATATGAAQRRAPQTAPGRGARCRHRAGASGRRAYPARRRQGAVRRSRRRRTRDGERRRRHVPRVGEQPR